MLLPFAVVILMLVLSWMWIWIPRKTNVYSCFFAAGTILTLFLNLVLKRIKLFPINEEEMLVLHHHLPFDWLSWTTPILSLQICSFCVGYVWMVTGSVVAQLLVTCWCAFVLKRVCPFGIASGAAVGLLVGWLANRFLTGSSWETRPDDNAPR